MSITNIECSLQVIFILLVLKCTCSVQMDCNNLWNNKGRKLIERGKRQISDFESIGDEIDTAQKNKKCFGQFCLPKHYNRLVLPTDVNATNETKNEIDVHLDFDIRVFEVNDIRFTVSFTMYFGIRWEEPRLLRKNNSKSYDTTLERVDLDLLQHLWLPSIYILNLKSYKTLNIFSEFAGENSFSSFNQVLLAAAFTVKNC